MPERGPRLPDRSGPRPFEGFERIPFEHPDPEDAPLDPSELTPAERKKAEAALAEGDSEE